MHGPPDWSITNSPAASAQATISKAAQPGMAHVCTSISASLAAVAAQTVTKLLLRDGATGVGAILWSMVIVLPINGLFEIALSDLVIKGTVGNAMTLEFDIAPVASNLESVALTGYDSA